MLGDNEDINTPAFLARGDKEGFPPIKNCATLGKNYEWAEYKTSLLLRELTNDNNISQRLLVYLHNIANRLFHGNRLGVTMENELILYSFGMIHSHQNDTFQQYPVAQSRAWVRNHGFGVDINGLTNDFYAFFNFLKWVILKMSNGVYPCNAVNNLNYLIIHGIQQRCFNVLTIVRQSRVNRVAPLAEYDDKIGITNIIDNTLIRRIPSKPHYVIQPWLHPGESQCRVPYRGKYGQFIRESRVENDYYGSMKCNISGSVLYLIFLYTF